MDYVRDMMDTPATAAKVGVRKNTLEIWRVKGIGPKFVKVGRRVMYRISDVEAYLDANTCQSTSSRVA